MSEQRWEDQLVAQLMEFANPDSPTRAVLAHLRRGIDGTIDYTLGRVGWLFSQVPDDDLDDVVLAAGLFAWVKGDCGNAKKINFGAAFGSGLSQEEKQKREKRFIALLDTDREELPYMLRQAITLIAPNRVGLDWVLLIRHLCQWSHSERWVQQKWARSFWAAPELETTPELEQPVSQ
jgi:CRISPR type I-E-associated protein CasB/Cse2